MRKIKYRIIHSDGKFYSEVKSFLFWQPLTYWNLGHNTKDEAIEEINIDKLKRHPKEIIYL